MNDPAISSNEIASQIPDCNLSARTIRQVLFNRGLKSYVAKSKPLLNRKMIKSRIQFCKKYKNESEDFWKRVIYADESYIQIDPNSIINRIRRTRLSDPHDSRFTRKTTKFPYKLMIWGCFNHDKIGPYTICEGSMTGKKYVDVLEENLKPFANNLNLTGSILLDDSARPHRTKEVDEWLQKNEMTRIDWPGNSPDLNPIENLWGIVKSKLRRTPIFNKTQLLKKFKEIWTNQLSNDLLANLSNSMPKRISEVLKNKGKITKY